MWQCKRCGAYDKDKCYCPSVRKDADDASMEELEAAENIFDKIVKPEYFNEIWEATRLIIELRKHMPTTWAGCWHNVAQCPCSSHNLLRDVDKFLNRSNEDA